MIEHFLKIKQEMAYLLEIIKDQRKFGLHCNSYEAAFELHFTLLRDIYNHLDLVLCENFEKRYF